MTHMRLSRVPTRANPMLQGRRLLDLAEGILIALRHYAADAAFEELVTVAHRHGLSVSATAEALMSLAIEGDMAVHVHPEAMPAARLEWGDLLGDDQQSQSDVAESDVAEDGGAFVAVKRTLAQPTGEL